ncbi:hypothetical protein U1Q18_005889 [Sarracenia purpurea var. burkii]
MLRKFYNSLIVSEEELDTYKGKVRGVSFTFTLGTIVSLIGLTEHALVVPQCHYYVKVDYDSVATDLCDCPRPWKVIDHLMVEEVLSDAHLDELAKLSKPITKATATHNETHVSKRKRPAGSGTSAETLDPFSFSCSR